MCEACFELGFPRFDSWQTFEAFEQALRLKKGLVWWERPETWPVRAPFGSYDPEEFRQCSTCGQVWALASPDNAWRGYFLPEDQALEHLRQLQLRDKAKRWGCAGLVAASLLVLLVRWVWGSTAL